MTETARRIVNSELAATPYAGAGIKNEGKLTQAIEAQTAWIPCGDYLGLAVGAMVVSAALTLGARGIGNFIVQWAPTILIMGLYDKLVEVEEEMGGASTMQFLRTGAEQTTGAARPRSSSLASGVR